MSIYIQKFFAGKIAAGVCCKIIIAIALHHPVSAAGSVLQNQEKIRVFEKNRYYKNKTFSSLTASFEEKTDITKKIIF